LRAGALLPLLLLPELDDELLLPLLLDDPLEELELELDPELLESLSEELLPELELLLSLSLELLSVSFFSAFIFSCCNICSCICRASSLGAFLRCSRSPSVSPPRPTEVKKLIAKRVLRAVSVGKRPEKTSCM
jgi:hypothetical protein